MPFAADRDLLVLEPQLFRDVAWAGQRLAAGTASISGTTLTASGAIDFAAQAVTTGHVALVDGVPVEVITRVSTTQLTVSRPRASLDDAAVPPTTVTNKPLAVWTFLPQIQLAHDHILRMLGIEPGDAGNPATPDALTEAAVMNPRSLRLVEALAALHTIFAAASAVSSADAFASRAEMYRRRFDQARRVAAARIDLDADGLADTTRFLNVTQLTRV
ncbi:MAG: hypothetical protein AB7K52_16075 [Phycisphaerales bacterium]